MVMTIQELKTKLSQDPPNFTIDQSLFDQSQRYQDFFDHYVGSSTVVISGGLHFDAQKLQLIGTTQIDKIVTSQRTTTVDFLPDRKNELVAGVAIRVHLDDGCWEIKTGKTNISLVNFKKMGFDQPQAILRVGTHDNDGPSLYSAVEFNMNDKTHLLSVAATDPNTYYLFGTFKEATLGKKLGDLQKMPLFKEVSTSLLTLPDEVSGLFTSIALTDISATFDKDSGKLRRIYGALESTNTSDSDFLPGFTATRARVEISVEFAKSLNVSFAVGIGATIFGVGLEARITVPELDLQGSVYLSDPPKLSLPTSVSNTLPKDVSSSKFKPTGVDFTANLKDQSYWAQIGLGNDTSWKVTPDVTLTNLELTVSSAGKKSKQLEISLGGTVEIAGQTVHVTGTYRGARGWELAGTLDLELPTGDTEQPRYLTFTGRASSNPPPGVNMTLSWSGEPAVGVTDLAKALQLDLSDLPHDLLNVLPTVSEINLGGNTASKSWALSIQSTNLDLVLASTANS